MAIKGRKPKPLALHILNGNPSKLDIKKKTAETPKPKPINLECTERLSNMAKEEWERIAPELEKIGILKVTDKVIFELYCQVYSECIELENFIKENGMTYTYTKKNKDGEVISEFVTQYPQVSQLDRKRNLLIKVCAEFGMTPSSRGRMSLPIGDDPDESPMSRLFREKLIR